ncbi:MAG TPA: zeta toxin family protein [Pyrinomonadaceae bacterium]|nr:zeta toxin family protein [Pyrinomonadaceae bacterium]
MTGSSPQLILIAGPNGAGKSTLAPFLLRDAFGPMQFVNADAIAVGLSAFRPETVAFEAGRIMLKRLYALAEQRASFAFESTLASRLYAAWIDGLCRQGYEFHLIFLSLRNSDLAVQRVRERVRAGGHDVADSVIRRRFVRGAGNFFGIYRALADTWLVYDNSARHNPLLIARGSKEGGEKVIHEDIWQQFERVADEGGK